MIQLVDSENGRVIGAITEEQLQFLVDQLEEESLTDQDYYVDAATLEMFEATGGDPALITMLRQALGAREGMEVRWSRT